MLLTQAGAFKSGDDVRCRAMGQTPSNDFMRAKIIGFRYGDNTAGPLSMGAELHCEDGKSRFKYLHDLSRDNPDFMNRAFPKVGPVSSVEAAAAAIDAHTKAFSIDDDGDPVNIGMWHLLTSLIEYAIAKGANFDDILADVRARFEVRPLNGH